MQTYIADGFDKRLVCADFSFLERGDAGSNPGDKSKLPPPAHLVPSLKPEICIHSFIICTKHAYTHEYNKTFTFKESWRLDLRPLHSPPHWSKNSWYSTPLPAWCINLPSYLKTALQAGDGQENKSQSCISTPRVIKVLAFSLHSLRLLTANN